MSNQANARPGQARPGQARPGQARPGRARLPGGCPIFQGRSRIESRKAGPLSTCGAHSVGLCRAARRDEAEAARGLAEEPAPTAYEPGNLPFTPTPPENCKSIEHPGEAQINGGKG